MKNVPYVKIMDGNTIMNPITKENPYVSNHPNRSARRDLGRLIMFIHPMTGKRSYLKVRGNNKANTSEREGVESRMNSTRKPFFKLK
jgi:hypothetical protein